MKKILIINIILILLIYFLPNKQIETKTENIVETSIETPTEEIISNRNEEIRTENTMAEEIKVENKSLTGYRITSYYPAESNNKTGSGKTTSDFTLLNVNGKTVYAYEGRIVVAAATNELLKSGYNVNGSQNKQNKHYFNYYDTGRIKINNEWYGFIVLDSCGASMWEGYYRLDIFVPNSDNVIDTKNVEIIYD